MRFSFRLLVGVSTGDITQKSATALTPELSRAALRLWASEDHSDLHEPRSGLGLNELLGPGS